LLGIAVEEPIRAPRSLGPHPRGAAAAFLTDLNLDSPTTSSVLVFTDPQRRRTTSSSYIMNNRDRDPPAAFPPAHLQPSERSVIMGKGSGIRRHSGNQHLRFLAAQVLQSYTDCSRQEKTEIVDWLLATTKAACPVGAFVKEVGVNRCVEVSDKVAREKIGYMLRDLAHDRYRSSTKSKSATRRRKATLLSNDGNQVDAKVPRHGVESSLPGDNNNNNNNIKIRAEATQIRALSSFPVFSHPVPVINAPESQPILSGGLMVAAPPQQLRTTAAVSATISCNASTPCFTRGGSTPRTIRQSRQPQGPLRSPPRLTLKHSSSCPGVGEALLDPQNQPVVHPQQLHGARIDDRMLEPSAFACTTADYFSALPPHITVAEAVLRQGTYTAGGFMQQPESGHARHLPAQNSTATKQEVGVKNRPPLVVPDHRRGTSKPMSSADDEWAFAFGSSPSDESEHQNHPPPTTTTNNNTPDE
jgi:hypothetical protein